MRVFHQKLCVLALISGVWLQNTPAFAMCKDWQADQTAAANAQATFQSDQAAVGAAVDQALQSLNVAKTGLATQQTAYKSATAALNSAKNRQASAETTAAKQTAATSVTTAQQALASAKSQLNTAKTLVAQKAKALKTLQSNNASSAALAAYNKINAQLNVDHTDCGKLTGVSSEVAAMANQAASTAADDSTFLSQFMEVLNIRARGPNVPPGTVLTAAQQATFMQLNSNYDNAANNAIYTSETKDISALNAAATKANTAGLAMANATDQSSFDSAYKSFKAASATFSKVASKAKAHTKKGNVSLTSPPEVGAHPVLMDYLPGWYNQPSDLTAALAADVTAIEAPSAGLVSDAANVATQAQAAMNASTTNDTTPPSSVAGNIKLFKSKIKK